MEARLKQLSQLHCYVESADKEVTVILQNLKWDRKRLLEVLPMTICSYDRDHKLPQENLKTHEEQCFLKSQSYVKEDLLPDPLDTNANTLVKLNTQEIMKIIDDASIKDPIFKKGNVRRFTEPLSLERLQFTYTADERRAIHDAVVSAVPSCHDLADLALPSTDCDKGVKYKEKSRSEILAELRNMKRRRPKYRVAAKTRNYSDVLRDVIKTQMEFYSDAIVSEDTGYNISKETHYQEKNVAIQSETEENQRYNNDTLKYRKNTDWETFASKNKRSIEHSKRKTEDRRKRSYYDESNRDEGERETKYKYSDGMESSARNGKKRQYDYYKQNSYRRNSEDEPHVRDKSKTVQDTRSYYRENEEKRGGNKNTDRESHRRDELARFEYSENYIGERDSYSKHRKRNRSRDYYDSKSERRRKHSDYYYYSHRDEAERGRGVYVKKERLDTTDREHRTRSSRSDYYDSFNSNIQNKKAYLPIKVEKLEPETGESAPRDEYNATNNSYKNNTGKIYIKREKESTDSESIDSDSSSSYSSSSSSTRTEEERSTSEETDKPPSTKRRKAYGEYVNTSYYQNAQSTNKHGRPSYVNKIETFEMEPRHKEHRNVYYSSSYHASDKANLRIKLEQTHSGQRQGRDGLAIDSKYNTAHAYNSEWCRDVRERHSHTVYYGSSTGGSRATGSSGYYSSSYREVKGYEQGFSRGIHVYNNDKAYATFYRP